MPEIPFGAAAAAPGTPTTAPRASLAVLLGAAFDGSATPTSELASIFLQAFDHAPTGMAILDLPGQRHVYVNPAFCRLLGREAAELRSLTAIDVAHPRDPNPLDDLALALAMGDATSERRFCRPDGTVATSRRTLTVIRDSTDTPTLLFVQHEDVTDAAATAARARDTEDFARSVLDSLTTRTAVLDRCGAVVAVNAGWTAAQVRGDTALQGVAIGSAYLDHLDALPHAAAADLAAGIRAVMAGKSDAFSQDYAAERNPQWYCLQAHRMGSDGSVVVSHTDITTRRQHEERIAFTSFHDELTGLPNRTLFFDRLTQAVARSRRRLTSAAVMLLDLDGFKLVNDSLGHRTGDLLLMEVAHRLQSVLRPGDTVARFGGDEFAILCEELVSDDQALDLAERLLAVLEEPLRVKTREVAVTGSIGIALSGAGTDPESLLQDADAAMYRAKERGRGRCELFDQRLRHRAVRRLELEQDLRTALEEDQFLVVYQPVVDLATNEAHHVEALVRWLHPERGLVPPSDFIPVAEETGQILALGRFVLRQACLQAADWFFTLGTPISVGVNLSTRQLTDPKLLPTVQAVLKETNLPGELLCFEITESAIMQDANAAVETMQRLRRLGVRLSVDDFGTGYSSLAYLRRFPIDQLKIDRSFINALDNDAQDVALVSTIIELAKTLRMHVVAEGVERADQAALLKDLGCEKVQGYYFARPMAPADVTPLLAVPLHP